MKKPRILYIGNSLAASGVNPTTIDLLGAKLTKDFEVIKVSDKLNIFLRIADIWWTIIVKRTYADVIIIDTYSTMAFHYAWSSAYLARLFKIPYIPFIHGGDFPKRIEKSPKLVSNFLKHAERIITPSGFLKEKIASLCEGKSQVIPNFLDLSIYPYRSNRVFRGIKLLWVRALAEIYNPWMALDVLGQLHTMGFREARLTMVGGDKEDMKERLTEYAKSMGLSNFLHLTGSLSKQEWLDIAQESDCFINTTTVDNTPVSVMEAMAIGLPVISTDVGGIPFIIEDGEDGLLVKDGDVKAMVEAILSLKKDIGLYRKITEAAREKALNWDWEKVRLKWSNLLSKY